MLEPKLLASAVALAVLYLLEGVAPMFVGRGPRAGHAARHLGLAAVNAGMYLLVFAAATVAVAAWAEAEGAGLVRWLGLSGWQGTVVALVLFDAWMYGWHVLNHKVPLLWRFHAVHHADAELDASSGVRFHTGEVALSALARLAVLPLLGMTVGQLVLYEAILLPVILFHHANIRIPARLDAALRLIIPTPYMHWVHHSRLRAETDSNYGSVLSIWDRLFRTFRLRARPEEIALGLDGWEPREWGRLPGLFAAPFRRRRSP